MIGLYVCTCTVANPIKPNCGLPHLLLLLLCFVVVCRKKESRINHQLQREKERKKERKKERTRYILQQLHRQRFCLTQQQLKHNPGRKPRRAQEAKSNERGIRRYFLDEQTRPCVVLVVVDVVGLDRLSLCPTTTTTTTTTTTAR